MTWKRATTIGLWVLVAVVPGGLWAMALYVAAKAARAARAPLAQMRAEHGLGQPLSSTHPSALRR